MIWYLKMRVVRGRSGRVGHFILIALWISSLYLMYFYTSSQVNETDHLQHFSNGRNIKEIDVPVQHNANRVFFNKDDSNDRMMPLIFIGGMPRSGTTLMRAMLDAHPEIRCGQETRIIPRILGMRANWLKSPKERNRLEEAGVTHDVINAAVSKFILEVIVKHGQNAKHLCNKDPFTLKSLRYLLELFPNAKFILMLRDGRATAHSIISRKVTITGFDINSYRDVLTKWNRAIEAMYSQCRGVSQDVCLLVHYEQLVLQPIRETRKIFRFLEIPYNDAVLNHEDHISDISLSSVEKSTDQVQRPLYLDALSSWFGKIPADVVRDMAQIAPMLQRMGYDPHDQTPKYGEPDALVRNKTRLKANGT